MPDEEAPKSAYELAMARLQKKDKEEGVVDRPLTEAQRSAIAEARKVGEARLAEREIMHRSQVVAARGADPAALEKIEAEYRRDRERITYDRDKKIEAIRSGK